MTPDRSSIQRRHIHCGAFFTTEQQANRCQQSHLMELWLNSNKSSEVAWDPLSQNADLQATRGYNTTEAQESSVSPETYGCKGYWTTSFPPDVSKCGTQCH